MKWLMAAAVFTVALTGCMKSDPGPVGGTWRVSGPVAMTVQYRAGESEAMGIIEKVRYEVKGSIVIVTTESGPMAGTGYRLRVIDANTLQSELGTMRRVR
jgi:hypothetical protein